MSIKTVREMFPGATIENYQVPDYSQYYQPYFEYRQASHLTNESVPEFAKAIFEDPFILNSIKQNILDEVISPFILDKNFKDSVSGKILAIINNERYLIISSISDIENVLKKDETSLVVPIGPLLLLNSHGQKIIVDHCKVNTEMRNEHGEYIATICKDQHYKLKCGVSVYNAVDTNMRIDNKINCIYDSGLSKRLSKQ